MHKVAHTRILRDSPKKPENHVSFILVCEETMLLKVGDEAPDFDLEAVTSGRTHRVRLSDFRGKKNVVAAFHPLDWTPT